MESCPHRSGSSFNIINSTFTDNSAGGYGGVIHAERNSYNVISSEFTGNNAARYGGVMHISISFCNITSSTFINNSSPGHGGVMSISGSSLYIASNSFTNNSAGEYGGVIAAWTSSFSIKNDTFITNSAASFGGVMATSRSSVNVTVSTFAKNSAGSVGGTIYTQSGSFFKVITSTFIGNNAARYGGVITAFTSSFSIMNDTFITNSAASFGGVMATSGSFVNITVSTFAYNSADSFSGTIYTQSGSSFNVINSIFIGNNAARYGGVLHTTASFLNIRGSTFTNNSAPQYGGVMSTSRSSFNITNSIFIGNSAGGNGGLMQMHGDSFNDIDNPFPGNSTADLDEIMALSTFSFSDMFADNGGSGYGGVIHAQRDSSFSVIGNVFIGNNAAQYGGVMHISESSFIVTSSSFTSNSAGQYGAVVSTTRVSSFRITDSTFTNNRAAYFGGVMALSGSSFNVIADNIFASNSAGYFGGVIHAQRNSSFNVTNSAVTYNSAAWYGGFMASSDSSFNITNTTFIYNSAGYFGGVIHIERNSFFNVINSTFASNHAAWYGGVVHTRVSSFSITSSIFTNNSAPQCGGVMATSQSSFNIINSIFTDNSAAQYGGVMNTRLSSFIIIDSSFSNNSAKLYGGVIFTFRSSSQVSNTTFVQNLGSFYIFDSSLSLSGLTEFENCSEPPKQPFGDNTHQEGGAITTFLSHIEFYGVTNLLNNQARCGGAILALESKIRIYGETTLVGNMAVNGGGVSLYHSDIEIRGNCIVSHNLAVQGGGIRISTSSSIIAYQRGKLQFHNNSAEAGGGMYLEKQSHLKLSKSNHSTGKTERIVIFFGNHASYGGGMFVADDTNAGACLPMVECFVQALALYHQSFPEKDISTLDMTFSENSAEYGSNLFGGLLDRCIPSKFAEVYRKHNVSYSGATYLGNISDITLDSIASLPLRVCFCNSKGWPDCSYNPPPTRVKKGETFTVSLVAVDQINNSVDANVTTLITSFDSGLGEGQQTQKVKTNCTDLTYHLVSSKESETVTLFADGPCGDSPLSIRQMNVQFLNCTCPIGFEPSSRKSSTCECNCDSRLFPYITTCNSTTSSLLRVNTNAWISYTNDTNPPGYIIHPLCPIGYCYPPSTNIELNLNLLDGADAQCAYNRTAVLCGACQENFSLSLGSSRCVPCYSHWPIVLVAILLAAFIAGILLVSLLLLLNMTVAIGIINGFIFYANIVAASNNVFFPSSEPSFPTVFIAWLNLDIGIDVCFFDGLDAYTKIWLQLAFPVYIISLVIIVIKISECSSRFTTLIGKRDPVAALATLILLSYSKLLSITITALALAVLQCPNGSKEIVWLLDGNVKYFQGKHIAVVIMALFIILISVPYTVLLFLRQWLVWTPRWKIIKWMNIAKLNHFISFYHVPYHSKYHYWTGLLLLVRVVVYITASITASSNPQTSVIVTIILVGSLFLLSRVTGERVYQNSVVDIVNTVLYFNLLMLAALSLYNVKADVIKQTTVAYISTSITFILLIGVIIYHVALLIKKDNTSEELNEYLLVPVGSMTTDHHEVHVTHSVVEIPQPPSETNDDNIQWSTNYSYL